MRERSGERARRPIGPRESEPFTRRTSAEHPWLRVQRSYGNLAVQRALAGPAELAAGRPLPADLIAEIGEARGRGRELERPVREGLEDALDADLGAVRVHTDERADTLAGALNAQAFTTFNDVFFRRASYDPNSPPGRRLLAHELTHVLQQTGGLPQPAARDELVLGESDDVHEQAAEAAASATADGRPAGAAANTSSSVNGAVQRQVLTPEQMRSGGVSNLAGARREDVAAQKRSRKVRAKWKHQELREKAGAGYKPEESLIEKGAGKVIEKGAEKVAEKARELATEIPKGELPEPEETPESLFLKDMASGMAKAKEYLEYIETATEWWQKYKGPRPAGVDSAVADLNRITGTINSTMGTAIKVAKRGKEIVEFLNAAAEVARATEAWKDPSDVTAREAWEKAAKKLASASVPLLEWARKYLYEAALAGEAWAGAASFTLSYVIAEVQIGWKAYEVGRAAIETGKARQEEALRMSDPNYVPPPEAQAPPPPSPPLRWYSQRELAELYRSQVQEVERRKAREALIAENQRIERLKERFQTVFVGIYRKYRPRLKKQIETKYVSALKARQLAEQVPEERWWDALISDGTEYEIEGAITVEGKLDAVTRQQAETEIAGLQGAGCPEFDQLYFNELNRWLQTQLRKMPPGPASR